MRISDWSSDVCSSDLGMYLRGLFEGLADIPAIPDEARAEARAKLAQVGPEGLHLALSALDPETASRLMPGDSQRLVRAYEVVLEVGRASGRERVWKYV